ncbi:peptidoglycan hydrolase-like protein with peptidoglycan-binding domain [Crossiella equi]|uniref:Peptidoglycan hydrolase-like protein with peptidoglycan-binding domain n=1 Tax=Crossiella equi TaxID=130796 RepID=A0ABS5AN47_9PSEU|nr:peptidoglycan hydrolase-like protein with peptidoglycan-binding domain [Crossiella equi]
MAFGAAGVAVLALGGLVWFLFASRPAPQAAPGGQAARTVAVVRTDLSLSQEFAGTLGFGPEQVVKGAGAGLVTKLPKAGEAAERGAALFRVNDRPVPVFFGATPLFRKLEVPAEGEQPKGGDVAVVADNLRALGHKLPAKLATYTPALASAVKAWQRKAGLPDTGTLEVGQVLVLPGPARVASVTAQPGDPAAGPLLTVTATEKVVSVEVPATEADRFKAGAEVVVTRPDSKELPGTVASVGTVVSGGKDASGQGGPPKITVVVTPKDPADLAGLDAAAVRVRVPTETRPGVLAVPLGALVALREGGYAVQLPGGQLRAVTTGLFAKELVEVSGDGVTEGLTVVTSS